MSSGHYANNIRDIYCGRNDPAPLRFLNGDPTRFVCTAPGSDRRNIRTPKRTLLYHCG